MRRSLPRRFGELDRGRVRQEAALHGRCPAPTRLEEAESFAGELGDGLAPVQRVGDPGRHDLAFRLREDARLRQCQSIAQRDDRDVADRVDLLESRLQGPGVDRDPARRTSEARLTHDRRGSMRRHGEQQVERDAAIFDEHLAGTHLDGGRRRPQADAGLRQAPVEGGAARFAEDG